MVNVDVVVTTLQDMTGRYSRFISPSNKYQVAYSLNDFTWRHLRMRADCGTYFYQSADADLWSKFVDLRGLNI